MFSPAGSGPAGSSRPRVPGRHSSVGAASAIAAEPVPRSTTTGTGGPPTARASTAHCRRFLGLGPRDEHTGPDRELQVAERRPTGQMLQRDAGAPRERPGRRNLAGGWVEDGQAGQAASVPEQVRGEQLLGVGSGLVTPASDSRPGRGARRPPASTGAIGARPPDGAPARQGLGGRGVGARTIDVELAVEHLVEVVGLEPDAVVGDPVLRVVVGADPLAAVDRADLLAGAGGVLVRRVGLLRLQSSRARRIRSACSLFCSWLFSFWQDTTVPVGRCVMRTAESVVLTLCPPGPEDRKTSMRRSPGSMCTSTSCASGNTSTPAALVWIRP